MTLKRARFSVKLSDRGHYLAPLQLQLRASQRVFSLVLQIPFHTYTTNRSTSGTLTWQVTHASSCPTIHGGHSQALTTSTFLLQVQCRKNQSDTTNSHKTPWCEDKQCIFEGTVAKPKHADLQKQLDSTRFHSREQTPPRAKRTFKLKVRRDFFPPFVNDQNTSTYPQQRVKEDSSATCERTLRFVLLLALSRTKAYVTSLLLRL